MEHAAGGVMRADGHEASHRLHQIARPYQVIAIGTGCSRTTPTPVMYGDRTRVARVQAMAATRKTTPTTLTLAMVLVLG